MEQIPVVHLAEALGGGDPGPAAEAIDDACRRHGFFVVCLLTLLRQDEVGGLELRGPDGWIPVPPVPDGFVCNLGDMLERATGGAYRSTPHRVRRPAVERLSMPFFLDPSWDAEILPVPGLGDTGAPARWDGRSVFDFEGTYGSYFGAKVASVFPAQAGPAGLGRPDISS